MKKNIFFAIIFIHFKIFKLQFVRRTKNYPSAFHVFSPLIKIELLATEITEYTEQLKRITTKKIQN